MNHEKLNLHYKICLETIISLLEKASAKKIKISLFKIQFIETYKSFNPLHSPSQWFSCFSPTGVTYSSRAITEQQAMGVNKADKASSPACSFPSSSPPSLETYFQV